jgi:hypothetical protein
MLKLGKDKSLNAYDAIAIQPGNYRVVQYKDTLDVEQFIGHLKNIGY